jgi:excisionase family DNA binding protein
VSATTSVPLCLILTNPSPAESGLFYDHQKMNDVLCEAEVAQLLDCEPSTIQTKARENELPGVKYGRSWLFPRAALLEVLNRQAMQNLTAKPKPSPLATTRKEPGKGKRTPPALPA